jgi:hypothetical protein
MGMSVVESHYQATTGEDTALRRLNTCCSGLQIGWIIDSAIATCRYDM